MQNPRTARQLFSRRVPPPSVLRNRCSTTELHWRVQTIPARLGNSRSDRCVARGSNSERSSAVDKPILQPIRSQIHQQTTKVDYPRPGGREKTFSVTLHFAEETMQPVTSKEGRLCGINARRRENHAKFINLKMHAPSRPGGSSAASNLLNRYSMPLNLAWNDVHRPARLHSGANGVPKA